MSGLGTIVIIAPATLVHGAHPAETTPDPGSPSRLRVGQGGPQRRSSRKGQSVEFADFRSYVHGDDLRFIDWNTYARLDRLFLKLFLEEEDLSLYVLLDLLEGVPEKAEAEKAA